MNSRTKSILAGVLTIVVILCLYGLSSIANWLNMTYGTTSAVFFVAMFFGAFVAVAVYFADRLIK